MKHRKTIRLILASLVLVAVAGCTAPDQGGAQEEANSTPVLRRGNGGEPQTLDPALAEDVHAFNVLADLYEGLVIEAADGSLQPGVAENWDISPDGQRYTFHLRADATWSNGDPVSAQQFVMAFHRVLSPDSQSAYSFLLEPILNYSQVMDGSLPVDRLGIRAIDTRTLEIELQYPALYFPGILAMPIAFPIHESFNEFPGMFSDPDSFVGNGPYTLESWLIGDRIRLRKNPHFRAAASVEIDVVEYFPVSDPSSELNMFRAGELDVTATVPPAAIEEIRATYGNDLRIVPSLALYYLAFDLTEPPFDQVELRKALTIAIDREVLVSIIGRGEVAAYGIVPPGVANYDGARFAWANLAAPERKVLAQLALAQAGYGGDRPLRIKLTYDAGDIHETVAQTVSSMWQDVLGAEVELEKMEWKLFLATRDDRAAWQAMRFAWTGDYNDASTFLDIFLGNNPQNLPRFASDTYDNMLGGARRVTNPDARNDRLANAEALLLEEYPIAPLYFYVSKHLVSKNVRNFQDNILDRHPTRFLQIDLQD